MDKKRDELEIVLVQLDWAVSLKSFHKRLYEQVDRDRRNFAEKLREQQPAHFSYSCIVNAFHTVEHQNSVDLRSWFVPFHWKLFQQTE